jgi:coenzyme PQQ synthesis protein D (PqqD)
MGTNQIYDLNRTGYRVWQLLQEGSEAIAIRDRLREEFDVDQAAASKELDELLHHLSAEGLIEAESDADGPAA